MSCLAASAPIRGEGTTRSEGWEGTTHSRGKGGHKQSSLAFIGPQVRLTAILITCPLCLLPTVKSENGGLLK